MPMGIPTTGKGIHRASDWNGDLRLGILVNSWPAPQ
jgi:hypothetical protein